MSGQRYFSLGQVAGTPYVRYALLDNDHTVESIQISRPDGIEVERPAHVRWRHAAATSRADGRLEAWNNRGRLTRERKAGEQPRNTTWRRAGRTAAATEPKAWD